MNLNGNGELGDYELSRGYLRGDFVTGWETWDARPSGFEPRFTIPMGPEISLNLDAYEAFQGTVLPPVGVLGRTEDDPESDATFEPWITPVEGPPTDWDQVYAEFVILNPDLDQIPAPRQYVDIPVIDPEFRPQSTVGETSSGNPVEEEVAFWDTVGDIFTTTLPGAIDAYGSGQGWWGTPAPTTYAGSGPGYQAYIGQPLAQAAPAAVAAPRSVAVQDPGTCPPPGPRYMRYNCQTGVIDKIPRRRRRRLLTSSDLKDLAALKAIVGGGAKMDGAIVQAIRR